MAGSPSPARESRALPGFLAPNFSKQFTKWINRQSARLRARLLRPTSRSSTKFAVSSRSYPSRGCGATRASRFSFNTEGGRCETCGGQGVLKLEMSFLPSSYVPCEDCGGQRYNPQTLEVLYHDRSIGDVMKMTIAQAAEFFAANQKIARPLSLLVETGLGYLATRPAEPDLERRRSAAAQAGDEIDPRHRSRAERAAAQNADAAIDALPARGADYRIAHGGCGIAPQGLHRLVDDGNTVIVIEHNLSVIAEADYVVDIGPEAGH